MPRMRAMARGQGQRPRAGGDLPVAAAFVGGFVLYVWLLTRLTEPVVTVLSFVSGDHPKVYAALLAALTGLPGLLLTLPRALAPQVPFVRASVRSRRQLALHRRSYAVPDLLGVAALLLAQVPLPAPWGPAGKAATIANVTRSPAIVELSALFATWSLVVLAVGIAAAAIVRVYGHAAAYRVIGIILAGGAPVVAWFAVVRAIA